jgi:hypothetical protein
MLGKVEIPQKLLRKKTLFFQTQNKTHTILNFHLKLVTFCVLIEKKKFCTKVPEISTTPNTQKLAIFY